MDTEVKGAVLDLIEEIQSGRIIERKVQRAFCLGYVAGASNQINCERITENISENIVPAYETFKAQGII